ncbi:MAG: hypothetical protein ABIS68_03090 [Casimicrobiaceae bacterium]
MNLRIIVAAAVMPLLVPLAHAGPADYVFMPSVTYGEREIDFKAGTARKPDADRESAASLGLGYGVTQWWATEVYVKYKRELGEKTKFDAYEWENKFQLTEPGQFPVDIGFIVEVERPKDRDEGYEVTFGPLFQAEVGRIQLNGNVIFQRNYRAAEDNPLRLMYQWQAKYRWFPQFEFGAQGFGELGKWNQWAPNNEQSHRMGPAVFGKFAVGGRQAIKYNAGLLFDVNGEKRGNTFRMQAEYEF